MMEQQDDILAQLDDLNTRIELTINEISAARKSEIEALKAESSLIDSDTQTSGQQMPV